jgi:hypothetical protein
MSINPAPEPEAIGTRTRHNFRVPEDVWRPALNLAHSMHLSMSDVVEERLAGYVHNGTAVNTTDAETPQHTASISDEVWERAKKLASANKEKLSEVIRRELCTWLAEHEPQD